MKRYLSLILLLPALLLGGMGYAQDIPASSTAEVPSTVRPKRASKFQGLWQQRKGHSVYFDYGYQTGKLAYIRYYDNILTYKPIRFDLTYQYDIPWNPKRINFYAHAGFGYRQLKTDYKSYYMYWYQGSLFLLPEFEEGVVAYAGIGMKIHCTDWLHLSFSEAFNVMHEVGHGDFIGEGTYPGIQPGWKHTLVGLQSTFRIVGQIKGFSIYAGYRLDHWLKTFPNTLKWPFSLTQTDKNGKYEGYLTFGIGYTF